MKKVFIGILLLNVFNATLMLSPFNTVLGQEGSASTYIQMEIDGNKDTYRIGERIELSVKLSNPTPVETRYLLQTVVKGLNNNVNSLQQPIEGAIKGEEIIVQEVLNYEVGDPFTNGDYQVEVSLVINGLVARNVTDKFNVSEVDEELVYELVTCKDQNCESSSVIFLPDEEVFVDIRSEIDDITINANIIKPDASEESIPIPYSFVPETVGNYKVKVSAMADGYRDSTSITNFSIIEEDVKIKNIGSCNNNNICDNNEDAKTCPQDCVTQETASIDRMTVLYILTAISGLFLVVFVIGVIVFVKKRDKLNDRSDRINKHE